MGFFDRIGNSGLLNKSHGPEVAEAYSLSTGSNPQGLGAGIARVQAFGVSESFDHERNLAHSTFLGYPQRR